MPPVLPDVYFGRVDPHWNPATRDHHRKNGTFGALFDNEGSIDPDALSQRVNR